MPLSGANRLKLSKLERSKVGNKIEKIMKEGVRRNTHKPVSSSNPRRKVGIKQAIAIAYSMAKKK